MPTAPRSTPPANAPVSQPTILDTPGAAPLAAAIRRRGLVTPALLYLAGHRPLAFAAGHLLAVAAPTAAVLGLPRLMEWAHLLADPGGVDRLQAALAANGAPHGACGLDGACAPHGACGLDAGAADDHLQEVPA